MARLLLIAAIVSVLAAAARAADVGPAGQQRGQIVYDPKTGDWKETPPPEPGTERGDLDIARQYLAERNYAKARRALRNWLKTYPDSELRPEALFNAADTEVYAGNDGRSNDLWQAYEWYEEILSGGPGTELADRAVRRELIVAEMFLFKNHKRKVFKGLFRVSARDEALSMLDRIIDDHAAGTPLAEQAIRMQADYHFTHGEFDEAERAYARLARDFPRGKYEKLALERSADSALASFSGVEFDDAPLLEAEERFVQFQSRYPKAAEEQGVAEKLDRIRDSRAEKEFRIGEYYVRARKPDAAAFYYRSVVAHWPGTIWAEKAAARLERYQPAEIEAPAYESPASAPTTQP